MLRDPHRIIQDGVPVMNESIGHVNPPGPNQPHGIPLDSSLEASPDKMDGADKICLEEFGVERMRFAITLTTDGTCVPNPGSGGWGCVLRYTNAVGREFMREFSGREPDTTNNRMEMMAVIQGLEALKQPCRVVVVTDSQYVIGGMTGWKRRKNLDLWERLDRAANRHTVEWRWVKGHAGHFDNERCDQLAGRALAAR